jgi:hypothetical protein
MKKTFFNYTKKMATNEGKNSEQKTNQQNKHITIRKSE